MVDEKKVILMSRLAIYEQSVGKDDLEKAKYYKSDYVKYNCLRTLVSTTIVFWLVIIAYIYYNIGTLLEKMVDVNYVSLAYKVLLLYGGTCVLFLLFAWVLYTYRFTKAKPHIIEYNHDLKKLIDYYKREEQLDKKRRSN